MGNYRFKLSEVIPNAWFYKLRDMGKSRKQRHKGAASSSPPKHKHLHAVPTSPPKTSRTPTPHHQHSRRSYYYSRPGLADKTASPPTNSPSQRPRHRTTASEARSSPKRVSSAVSSSCSCRAKSWSGKSHSPGLPDFSTTSGDTSITGASFSPEMRSDHVLLPDENTGSWPSPCSCSSNPAAAKLPEVELRPIKTKPAKKPGSEPRKVSGRKPMSPGVGVRVRLSSPRVSVSGGRRSGSWGPSRRSTAVVKASLDPRRDFKESMVEMIRENNIRGSKDLEELLACYLCLNSDEYHDIIINVFKQIWLHLNLS